MWRGDRELHSKLFVSCATFNRERVSVPFFVTDKTQFIVKTKRCSFPGDGCVPSEIMFRILQKVIAVFTFLNASSFNRFNRYF